MNKGLQDLWTDLTRPTAAQTAKRGKPTAVTAFVAVAAVAFVIFFALMEIEGCVVVRETLAKSTQDKLVANVEAWHYWIQLVTSTNYPVWPGTNSTVPLKSCVAFTFAATANFMLSFAAALGFVWVVIKWLAERKELMELAQILSRRESELKAKIKGLLIPDHADDLEAAQQSQRVESAFREADVDLYRSLVDEEGEEQAARMVKALKKALTTDVRP